MALAAINAMESFEHLPSNALISRLHAMAKSAKTRPDFVLALNNLLCLVSTGGVVEGGLFDSMPVFAPREDKALELHIEIEDYEDREAGLLLLVLKDLWSGDLAVGV